MPENIAYVGVRAHYFTIEGTENAIPCTVERVVENPFSTVVMLQTTGAGRLRWELDKAVWETPGAKAPCISPRGRHAADGVSKMLDNQGRNIRYLRLSVTDRCNFRCRYCMPAEGVSKREHSEMLSFEELTEIVQTAVSLGVSKVRLTGGEPLVRRGIVDLCRSLRAINGVRELTMTTNGALLSQYAAELKQAGVDRLNISLDTLNEDKVPPHHARRFASRICWPDWTPRNAGFAVQS